MGKILTSNINWKLDDIKIMKTQDVQLYLYIEN